MNMNDNDKKEEEQNDDDEKSFCSKASFYFIIPPRQSLLELLSVIFLAPVYATAMVYMMHEETIGPDNMIL